MRDDYRAPANYVEYLERHEAEWDPPEPADEEFASMVRRLVEEADQEARKALRGFDHRSDFGERHRYTKGVCAGCGCGWDEETKGCENCGQRHKMRAKNAARRAAREPLTLVEALRPGSQEWRRWRVSVRPGQHTPVRHGG